MTLRTRTSKVDLVHRYYSCSTYARKENYGVQRLIDPRGQARHACHDPPERAIVPTRTTEGDPVLAVLALCGKGKHPESARYGAPARGHRSRRQAQAALQTYRGWVTEIDDVLKDRLNVLKSDRDRSKAALKRTKAQSSHASRFARVSTEWRARIVSNSQRECLA